MPLVFLRTWKDVHDHFEKGAETTFAAIMTVTDEFCVTMEENETNESLDFSGFTKYGAVESGHQYLVVANFNLDVVQFIPFEGTIDPQNWIEFITLTESEEFRPLFI